MAQPACCAHVIRARVILVAFDIVEVPVRVSERKAKLLVEVIIGIRSLEVNVAFGMSTQCVREPPQQVCLTCKEHQPLCTRSG